MKITFPSIAFCNLSGIFFVALTRLTIAQEIAAFCSAAAYNSQLSFSFYPENIVNPILIKKLESIVEELGGHVHYIQPICSESAVL